MQLYPTSGEWNAFLSSNPKLRAKYGDVDIIDIQNLSNLYFRQYLKIDPKEADRISEEIVSLAPIKSGKDRKIITH